MTFPEDLRYTAEHEWVRLNRDGTATMGITDYAQDALGDVVYVALPKVGQPVEANRPLGEVESTKSVSEIYSPCSGEVIDVNMDLDDSPERINSDPYGEGWIARLRPSNPQELEDLMDAASYRAMVEGQ
jgi:glycine cleavage system H protein